MWQPVNTLTEECYEYLGNLRGMDTMILSDMLRIVAQRDYGGLLSIVTSLQHPSLTTALRYQDQHHHWGHPGIGLAFSSIPELSMTYFPGGDHTARSTAQRFVKYAEDGADFIDLLMIRIPYDKKAVEEQISIAVARKEEYHRNQDRTRRISQSTSLRSSGKSDDCP